MPPHLKFKPDPKSFVPSLREAVEKAAVNADDLSVGAPVGPDGHILAIQDRHSLIVTDGTRFADWVAPPLRELFRGTEPPPPGIDRYPDDYVPLFWFVESHVLAVGDLEQVPTDAQFEEWYSNLKRRPDGRSLGPFHDFLWQVAALMLGIYPLSQAQFEGVFGALARSASRWRVGHTSRNYFEYLRRSFG